MPYCAKQDLIDRFGEGELIQLTDRTGAGVINDTVLNRAINDADGEINGYLAGRYALPLASTPPVLTLKACDMARYYLYEEAVPDVVKERYANAIAWLKGVAKGDISLGLDGAGAETDSAGLPEMQSAGSVFGRDNSY
jgi:phage gp36-like protein